MRTTTPALVLSLLLLTGCASGPASSSDNGAPAAPSSTASSAAAGGATVQPGATLLGSVGTAADQDAFTIALTTQDGSPVTAAAPGSYTITVDDRSAIHNFHLSGPGVDEATDVGGTGTKTFTVTLAAGTYTFVCDPHRSSMHGSFTVG